MKQLLIFDGNSIINRAFYGVRPLTAADGTPTNAVYGFFNMLLKFKEEINPDYVCVAFDLPGPTFRHEMYVGYKAQRKGMPDELAIQLPLVKELLDSMGIARIEASGYEADDIIGTLSHKCCEDGVFCTIVTGDRDSLQLVGDRVTVMLPVTKDKRPVVECMDIAALRERYGFEPEGIVELKALMGDSSDNIPGVPGIGEKTASGLVIKYKSIENIYENIDSLNEKSGVIAKLKEGKESAFLSKTLATIDKHVPLDCGLEKYRQTGFSSSLHGLLARLGLMSLIKRLGAEKEEEGSGQLSLEQAATERIEALPCVDIAAAISEIKEEKAFHFLFTDDSILFLLGEKVYTVYDGCAEFANELFANPSILKYTHDMKRAAGRLAEFGAELTGAGFDTFIAAYVLDPSRSDYSFEYVAERYHKRGMWTREEFVLALPRLCGKMVDIIKENRQEELYYEIELPLTQVLAAMERRGFLVDRGALLAFGEILDGEILRLQKAIYELAGGEFNINSPRQLGEVLFTGLGLPIVKKTKTGPSTDADVLLKLAPYHEIIGLILDFRQMSKLRSTYVTGLLAAIDEKDARVHSSFNQTITQTGRISSTEPNLQNIPVRRELGREIRKVFIAKEGHMLVDADYSQIELRVLAHIADDPIMIDAFKNGKDIHTITASRIFAVPVQEVTHEMRARAKTVNFGIIYGQGDYTLSQDLKISRKQAKMYIDEYFETYTGVKSHMEHTIQKAYEDGFVTTLYGRRRYIDELKSTNKNLRAFGERVAMNTPIQGSAADIIKAAMVRVENRIKKEGLKSRLLLQVHDELIVEAPEDEVERIKRLLSEEMEGACPLKVPLLAEAKAGKSWYDAKE